MGPCRVSARQEWVLAAERRSRALQGDCQRSTLLLRQAAVTTLSLRLSSTPPLHLGTPLPPALAPSQQRARPPPLPSSQPHLHVPHGGLAGAIVI
jgi:hypothetical protein